MKEKTNAEALPLADAPARRPYKAPTLKKLGSIRELTLGKTTAPRKEAGGGYKV